MKNKKKLLSIFILTFFLFVSGSILAQKKDDKDEKATQRSKHKLSSIERSQESSGNITIDDKRINYDVKAGVLPLLNEEETDTTAKMSYVYYSKKDGKNKESRPITFAYNGGPGSSTMWLHMGSIGPKRVITEDPNSEPEHLKGSPYELKDNEYSLLDVSDIVFIDMPGTGFGRILKDHREDYYGIDEDAKAFGQFINRFVNENNRWNSPKFLFGESYGTTRSAVLSKELQGTYNIDLNGIVLLSTILDFNGGTRTINPGNDLIYQTNLPSYAATAWYHDMLPEKHKDIGRFLKEVEDFSIHEYSEALDEGHKLNKESFNEIANKLHSYTGLSLTYIKKANLRIDGAEFEQELQNDNMKATGRIDTRYSGPTLDPLAQKVNYDPQATAISGPYVALLNDYFINTLNYGKGMYYRPNNYKNVDWNMERSAKGILGQKGVSNVMPDLAQTMIKNPKMNVMVLGGYFDLSTPYYQGFYEMNHLPMPKSLMDNIEFHYYKSGHMVYVHEPALKELRSDMKKFIENN